MDNTYKIVINRELIDEYNQYYLKKNPKCRNVPFTKSKNVKQYNDDGSPKLTEGGNQKTKKVQITKTNYTIDDCIYGTMSLNELLVIDNRMVMNTLKEKWGELGVWIANKYKLNDLKLTNTLVEYRVYSETKANKDNDNLSAGCKFLFDGLFVKSGCMIDDNFNHLNPLIICCHVDKEMPRSEIRISVFDDSIKDVYEKMKIHTENFKQ